MQGNLVFHEKARTRRPGFSLKEAWGHNQRATCMLRECMMPLDSSCTR